MKIPIAWVEVLPGDTVTVRGRRQPQTIESFFPQVAFDQDNRPHRETAVWLRTPKGRRSWAWVSEIKERIER